MRIHRQLKNTHLFKAAINILLVVIVNLGFVTAFGILLALDQLAQPDQNLQSFLIAAPYISLAAFLVADYLKMTRFYLKSMLEVTMQAFRFTFLLVLITSTLAFFLRAFSFPRSVLLLGTLLMFLLTVIWGWVCLHFSRSLYSSGKMIVVGHTMSEATDIAGKIQPRLSRLDIEIGEVTTWNDFYALLQKLPNYHEVLICPEVPRDVKSDLILICSENDQVVFVVPQFYELTLVNTRMVQFDDTLAFMMDQLSLTFEQRLVKRLFDISVSFIGVVLASPIMLLAWLAVKLTSKGPGLYKQERVTINNRSYNIYKFRTMRIDAEKETGPVISGKEDPRVTPVGRVLRRSKIDELPQLFNVLRGDMSIVGPRSERPFFVEQFVKEIPGYQERFKVKAGITGYAQVAGSYDTSPEDKLRYDILYIKRYSILLDIKLVFETVRAIFSTKLYNRTFQENKSEFTAPSTRGGGTDRIANGKAGIGVTAAQTGREHTQVAGDTGKIVTVDAVATAGLEATGAIPIIRSAEDGTLIEPKKPEKQG